MAGARGRLYKESMRTWSLPLIACSLIASLALACTPDLSGAPDTSGSAGTNPLEGISTAERGKRMRGRVNERLRAGSYTYLDMRLHDGTQEWIVVMGKAPAPGQEIEAVNMGTRQNFHSRRLDRTFDRLTFAWVPNI
jgi:hypothetical protein